MHCINIALALSAAMLVSAAPANVKQNPICNTQDKNRPGLTAQGPGGIYCMLRPTISFHFVDAIDRDV